MSKVSSGYVVSVAGFFEEDAVSLAVSRLKDHLRRHLTPLAKSLGFQDGYVREMFSGRKRMTLTVFVGALQKIERLGDREQKGRGREWVASILDALARPFGLAVVPIETRDVGEPQKEINEANAEIHRAMAVVADILPGGVTDAECRIATARLTKAKSEIGDVIVALEKVRIA